MLAYKIQSVNPTDSDSTKGKKTVCGERKRGEGKHERSVMILDYYYYFII